ncbi:MAG TPA: arginine deiminase-related protein [Woeseiaceae bacterium]|nr:arginine deiminase-related protein [Woeseiaceae bacterium]
MPESQLTDTVLMVRPVRFQTNPQTADSNAFQGQSDLPPGEQQDEALVEFEGLVAALRADGINVIVVDDTAQPHTPDSVFPNNWISFHADGRVVLYPMEAENRRSERRLDVLDVLNYPASEIVDLSPHESEGHFLEGTGSLVLDRAHRVAYACLSSRTHLDPLGDFAQRMGYEIVAFDAVDRDGLPVYHTNVVMSVGEELAVVCDAAIPRDDQRAAVLGRLEATGHEVLLIDYDQLEAFAGNMLELRTSHGERTVAMSRRAHASLRDAQQERLAQNGRTIVVDIDTIEDSAGGSVRCMLAEIHWPAATG